MTVIISDNLFYVKLEALGFTTFIIKKSNPCDIDHKI